MLGTLFILGLMLMLIGWLGSLAGGAKAEQEQRQALVRSQVEYDMRLARYQAEQTARAIALVEEATGWRIHEVDGIIYHDELAAQTHEAQQ